MIENLTFLFSVRREEEEREGEKELRGVRGAAGVAGGEAEWLISLAIVASHTSLTKQTEKKMCCFEIKL